jgi:hypothetical protein
MEAKFIGLALSNPNWNRLCSLVTRRHEDWIELSKCGSFEGNFFEPDPHITLYYNEDCIKGPNYLYWTTTCYCKAQYEAIKGYESILLLDPYIDTFNNDDARVLKVNVLASNCNAKNIITSWHDKIQEKLPPDNYPTYHPHITVTYLKPDTPDSVINKIVEELQTEKLEFKPTEILIGGGEDADYKSFRFELI